MPVAFSIGEVPNSTVYSSLRVARLYRRPHSGTSQIWTRLPVTSAKLTVSVPPGTCLSPTLWLARSWIVSWPELGRKW